MLKSLGILIGGVFIGAVSVEIVSKKYPDAVDKLRAKARRITSEAKDAFKNGYKNATHPKPAAA
ncbi:MAG: hypothetical protein JXA81_07640 [Sedimentisphaerales bacterium]|nr:hypothetical protein [Sedimentisphaerales bacterium]